MYHFIGRHKHTIDDKGRVSVPAKFREMLKESAQGTFYITKGLDGCLYAYPKDEWEKVLEKLYLLPDNREGRYYTRIFLSYAEESTLDKMGRVSIPQHLLAEAGLQKEVLIIGHLDHMEIWNPENFEKYTKEFTMSFEDAADKILKLKDEIQPHSGTGE